MTLSAPASSTTSVSNPLQAKHTPPMPAPPPLLYWTLPQAGQSNSSWHRIFADQHEVLSDGTWYYQHCNGGMSRIEIKHLDAALDNSSLTQIIIQHQEPVSLTPSTVVTAIDAEGCIYNSDVDNQSILTIYPNRTKNLLVQNPRLFWVDTMGTETRRRLCMLAVRLNRVVHSIMGRFMG